MALTCGQSTSMTRLSYCFFVINQFLPLNSSSIPIPKPNVALTINYSTIVNHSAKLKIKDNNFDLVPIPIKKVDFMNGVPVVNWTKQV